MSAPEHSRATDALDRLVRNQQRHRLFSRPRSVAGPLLGQSSEPDPTAVDGVSAAGRLRLPSLLPIAVGVVAVALVGGVLFLNRRPPPVEERLPVAEAGAATPPTSAAGSSSVAAAERSSAASTTPDGAAVTDPAGGAGGAPVFVHVAGAVASPGVVELPPGSRVVDAVRAAGGLLPDADSDRVNLAAPLEDGLRVLIPVVGAPDPVEVPPVGSGASPAGGGGGGSSEVAGGSGGPVDLNAADAAQLDELPGVGPATAAAIIAHRESEGPFSSVDALLDVRGIGEAKLEALRDLVTVSGG